MSFQFQNITLFFQGHKFQTTTLLESPFTYSLIFNDQTGLYETRGSFTDLLNTLSKLMNFTYEVEPPPDNVWGGKQANGSWNGMMKLIQENKKDFGIFYYILISKS